ncbi:hypothetical protein JMJ77_0010927 [Colletotrichum scovillei]|uniref:Uncharacterized protein n=1 Tax=Colletotrichum scovillei TaxID=1209932 RepID=A0A9P7R3K0_9PEZI|nr:hypothetical protein JMJ77_0010927 [Colletotrichum scovillei]KAG7059889.1 hypothetical protein JMJ78_0015175 [Colletotrichum scovillei]KAG7067344.1 hypothetical protein JMJ76_0008783 [Colletotrichum scovillei]
MNPSDFHLPTTRPQRPPSACLPGQARHAAPRTSRCPPPLNGSGPLSLKSPTVPDWEITESTSLEPGALLDSGYLDRRRSSPEPTNKMHQTVPAYPWSSTRYAHTGQNDILAPVRR